MNLLLKQILVTLEEIILHLIYTCITIDIECNNLTTAVFHYEHLEAKTAIPISFLISFTGYLCLDVY